MAPPFSNFDYSPKYRVEGGGGIQITGGLGGIFEIEVGTASDATFDFYYIANSVNVYIFRNVFIASSDTAFTPYILPANFSQITFYLYVFDRNNLIPTLQSYSKTMTSGTNGITGDSGDINTGIITFSILRNSHHYLRLLVEPP